MRQELKLEICQNPKLDTFIEKKTFIIIIFIIIIILIIIFIIVVFIIIIIILSIPVVFLGTHAHWHVKRPLVRMSRTTTSGHTPSLLQPCWRLDDRGNQLFSFFSQFELDLMMSNKRLVNYMCMYIYCQISMKWFNIFKYR